MVVSKPIKYALMGVAVIGAFAAGSWVSQSFRAGSEEEKSARAVEQKARPAFVLPDLAGANRSVSEWDGKVLVVNFWATWCPPCRREMPGFSELQQKLGVKGLQFVGIALDADDAVRDFVDTNDVPYPVLLGGDAALKVSDDYGNRFGALPYTAVVDRTGTITATYRGEVEISEIERLIQQLL